MNTEFTEYILKCDGCGAIKRGKTQNLELAKKITINHKKCGGEFRFFSRETTTIEPEQTAKPTEISKETYPRTGGDIMRDAKSNPINKHTIIFKCDACDATLEKDAIINNPEKAQNHTFPHEGCPKSPKGTFRFLKIKDEAEGSPEHYSNEKLKKIKDFICNNCIYNTKGKRFAKSNPCPRTIEIANFCYLENIEYRYLRNANLAQQETFQFAEDVKDVIIVIGEDEKHISLKDIKRLFINRTDRYSVQDPDKPEKFPDIQENLTDAILLKSLVGSITIGTRSINPATGQIKWVCYDVDKNHNAEPQLIVDTLVRCLKEWYNLTGYVEKSGSPQSFHVWVFLEAIDNEIANEFDKAFKARIKAVLNSMGVETLPESIDRGVQKGEGAMIKLPFNIQLKNGVRSEFLGDISKIQPEKLPV